MWVALGWQHDRTIQDNDEDIEEGIDENADLNSSRPTSSMSTGSSKSVSGSRGPQKSHPVSAHFKQEMVEGKFKYPIKPNK
ncbi:hypothetical protein OUZ56_003238 [Daphnia magna]|uniref:Uncharacterized protein n=1 Tax=Daphnia magna TaxID=35525 RepID=A0ABR0A859_9CRUS|nr:hypothetical protein OUZ56_003238 [Daphnia magna]